MITSKKNIGFTLIEVLIYTGILGITGAVLTGVLFNATQIKSRQTAVIEVNNQLNFALQNIQRAITDSSVIDIASGAGTSTLVLKYKDDTKNPTQFYVTNGILYKQEGQADAQPVTDSAVVVDAINFLKVSGYSGHDSVQIDLTIRYNSQNPDASFSKTLSSAIARVSAATFDSNLVPGADNFYDVGISSTKWKDMYLSGSMYLTGTASKIGVGTASPSAKIHNLVTSRATTFSAGDGTTWHDLIIQNPNNTLNAATGIAFELNSTYHSNAGTGIAAVKSTASSDYGADMVFVTRPQSAAATEKMRITSAGNVGIGTTAANGKLTIATTGTGTDAESDASILFKSSTTIPKILRFQGHSGTSDLLIYEPASLAEIRIGKTTGSATTDLVTFQVGGNVGIGTTTPSYKLDVNGTVNATEFYKDGVAFAGGSGIPGNAVVPFNQVSCPTGWVLADGSAGTPDLRGMFIRGAGTNASRTMSNGSYFTATYGQYQNDSTLIKLNGMHTVNDPDGNSQYGLIAYDPGIKMLEIETTPWGSYTQRKSLKPALDTNYGAANETRPANYAMIYCVKTTEDTEPSSSIWGTVGDSVVLNDSGKTLSITGNIIEGTRGQFYGYKTTSYTMSAANTWYALPWDTASVQQGITYNSSGDKTQITITNAGTYLISWSVSANVEGPNYTFMTRLYNLTSATEIPGSWGLNVRDYYETLSRTVLAKIPANSVIQVMVGTDLAGMLIQSKMIGPAPTNYIHAAVSITKVSNDQ